MTATITPSTDLTPKTIAASELELKTDGYCTTNTSRNLFYCNSPERLETGYAQLADDGKYFAKETVTGIGRIYTWHENQTGKTITSDILAYNAGTKTVTITISNRGLTNGTTYSDVVAWKNFCAGSTAITYTVAPKAYVSLATLKQVVTTGKCFGIIANFSIVDSSGANASLVLCDYAYANAANQSNATALAVEQSPGTNRRRGVGNGVYTYMYAPTLEVTNSNKKPGYKYGVLASAGSGFGGQDLRTISGSVSGPLVGDFGIQLNMQLTVKNSTGSTGNFKIALGSNGNHFYPIINKNGASYYRTSDSGARKFSDVMVINNLSAGESVTVNFFTVIPAGCDAPVVVCAYRA